MPINKDIMKLNIASSHSKKSIRSINIKKINLAKLSTAQLVDIVNSSVNAVFNLNGEILTWNKPAQLLYGYTSKEIIGKTISMLLPKEKKFELNSILNKIKKNKSINIISQKRTNDNLLIDVCLSISPIKS